MSPFFFCDDPSVGLVAECVVDRTCAEEHPAVEGRTVVGDESCVGEDVTKIGDDGGGLGDDAVAVAECRHLAHWVDRQVFGGFHFRAVLDEHCVVWTADLLEHPPNGAAAGKRICVEGYVVHWGPF